MSPVFGPKATCVGRLKGLPPCKVDGVSGSPIVSSSLPAGVKCRIGWCGWVYCGPHTATASMTSPIGTSIKRREDERLVTGRGRYLDDLRLPGILHAAIVRSPHAHARVTRIDGAPARALPGVIAVLT